MKSIRHSNNYGNWDQIANDVLQAEQKEGDLQVELIHDNGTGGWC